MKTDDFDDSKPIDADDTGSDSISANRDDHDSDGFNEFDAPPQNTSATGSLGEIWRNNPLIKIAVLVVGVVVLVAAFLMFGGGSQDERSQVGSALKEREAPGAETSEAYRDAVNEVNQQRLEEAMNTGESTMPIPTATPDTPGVTGQTEEPPVSLEDPLEGWRAGSQQTGADPVLDPNSPELTGAPTTPQQMMPMGPDPAAVDALAQAMSQQMQGILDHHKITGPQIMQVTSAESFFEKLNPVGDGTGSTTPPQEIREILIPAGTIVYGQTLTEANTDAPGPVLVRLSNGPLAGSRVLGTFNNTDRYLRLQFNTIVVKGVSQATNAVALDPKTTLPAMATEIDRRYWRRVLLPAAARFVEGMGEAIAQREQTVTVNNGTTVSSQSDLNTRQELAAGLAEGTQELADELDREGDSTKVMIKIHAGTPVGVLFMTPVLKDESGL